MKQLDYMRNAVNCPKNHQFSIYVDCVSKVAIMNIFSIRYLNFIYFTRMGERDVQFSFTDYSVGKEFYSRVSTCPFCGYFIHSGNVSVVVPAENKFTL